MAKVKIDGNEYDVDSLNETVKANLSSLQFVQNEIQRLNAQIAVYKTAEAAYSKVVQSELNSESD